MEFHLGVLWPPWVNEEWSSVTAGGLPPQKKWFKVRTDCTNATNKQNKQGQIEQTKICCVCSVCAVCSVCPVCPCLSNSHTENSLCYGIHCEQTEQIFASICSEIQHSVDNVWCVWCVLCVPFAGTHCSKSLCALCLFVAFAPICCKWVLGLINKGAHADTNIKTNFRSKCPSPPSCPLVLILWAFFYEAI